MKTLNLFLDEKKKVTIHTLASYIRQYILEQFPIVLHENHEKLERTFAKAGEYAYGVYGRTLFQPLQEELRQAGINAQPDFPGDFATTSIEYWGPPEERERCMWSVLSTASGQTLGTIVTRIFHDHTRFRIPHAPGIIVLEETETDAVLSALSHAATRLSGTAQEKVVETMLKAKQPVWEYSVEVGLADCLDSRKTEISEALLEHSLALWGNYGWELVTAVPSQGRLIAFFKRSGTE
ncbi:MAG: hypothetical protein H0U76_29435 [Ktedonobacteraceae bacterium]|nr:hypothetical protein [Ktedonobacteraceae bacterium]